jgi:amidase
LDTGKNGFVTTFITVMDRGAGPGPLLAVKDLIDVAGVPTTAGSRAVADGASPARADAACMAGARASGARVVGKANLFELAYGASGINEWFGTPINPFDPALVPGGSSSGSAVALAQGAADIAYGSDTGGSIRVPSAFCGTTGLKTTYGRISLDGVWPLAVSLDTVGPMARDVAGVVQGMCLLEPGFAASPEPALVIGRVRVPGVEVDAAIDAAVDRALGVSELDVVEITIPEWSRACRSTVAILDREAADANRGLLEDPKKRAKLGKVVAGRLQEAAEVPAAEVLEARLFQAEWRDLLVAIFARAQLLALPTVAFFPPRLEDGTGRHYTALTSPVNLAGLPALAQPVPTAASIPASIQLVGPPNAEAILLATGSRIEAAAASLSSPK